MHNLCYDFFSIACKAIVHETFEYLKLYLYLPLFTS